MLLNTELNWISPVSYSRKQSAPLFRKCPGTNGSSLPHSPEKRVTSRGIPKFSEISNREYFRYFPPWISGIFSLVHGSHFRKSTISDSWKTVARNSLSIPYLHSMSPRGHSRNIFLPFPEIYRDEWNSSFWNSKKRGLNYEVYQISYQELLFSRNFPIFGWLFALQKYNNLEIFSGHFRKKFTYHCSSFWNFGIFGSMESALF